MIFCVWCLKWRWISPRLQWWEYQLRIHRTKMSESKMKIKQELTGYMDQTLFFYDKHAFFISGSVYPLHDINNHNILFSCLRIQYIFRTCERFLHVLILKALYSKLSNKNPFINELYTFSYDNFINFEPLRNSTIYTS